MKSFEVLARGSAVSVAVKPNTPPVFLTTGRTAMPWVWQARHYPGAEWLKFVKPEHCRYTIEVAEPPQTTCARRRQQKPAMAVRYELDAASLLHHPALDVAALALASADEARYTKAAAHGGGGGGAALVSTRLAPLPAAVEAEVVLAGHALALGSGSDGGDGGAEEEEDHDGGGESGGAGGVELGSDAAAPKVRAPVELRGCSVLGTSATHGLVGLPLSGLSGVGGGGLSPGLSGGGVFGRLPSSGGSASGDDESAGDDGESEGSSCGGGGGVDLDASDVVCFGILEGTLPPSRAESDGSGEADVLAAMGGVTSATYVSSAAIRAWLADPDPEVAAAASGFAAR